MSAIIRIDNWCTRPCPSDNRYDAPERRGIMLSGTVTGHPRKPDGSVVDTSRIEKVDGRIVTTKSGSVYRLGRPDRKWLAWLTKSGRPYNAKQPIRVIE